MDVINISYVTSDVFVPITMTSVVSCLENNKNMELHFFIFCDNVSDDNKNTIINIFDKYDNARCSIIQFNEEMEKLITAGVVGHRDNTYTTYARIFVANMVPETVQRLIHIDSDTLVVGSLETVNSIDLGEKTIGMALDFINSDYKKLIGLQNHEAYYNAGIIIFDVLKWKKNKCTQRILDIINREDEKFRLVEQDILNEYFQQEIAEISIAYNFQTSAMIFEFDEITKIYNMYDCINLDGDEFCRIKSSPIIMHFAGIMFSRPFYDDYIHPMKDIYIKYYNLLPFKREFEKIDLPFYYKIQLLFSRFKCRKILVLYTKILQKLFVLKNKLK